MRSALLPQAPEIVLSSRDVYFASPTFPAFNPGQSQSLRRAETAFTIPSRQLRFPAD